MSDPAPITSGSAASPTPPPPAQNPNAGGQTPAPDSPTPPATPPPAHHPLPWSLRAGYRDTYGGGIYTNGFQILGTRAFQPDPHFRIVLQIEWNNQFTGDGTLSSLTRDGVLGQHFAGVRSSSFDGTTYTDVTGGSATAAKAYFMEVIPETHLMFRPVPGFPFEIGARLGFGITYTQLHTHTTITTSDPTAGHMGTGGCIPGDIHCGQGPIPEPTAGAGYGPFDADTGAMGVYARFGLRVAFPVNDYFQTGTEFLFRTNTTGGFDELWRTNIRLGIPLGAHFLLFAEPRYILSIPQGKPIAHGFDGVVGVLARW
jgi:hypothetical protein